MVNGFIFQGILMMIWNLLVNVPGKGNIALLY